MSETIISTEKGPIEPPEFAFDEGDFLEVNEHIVLPSGEEKYALRYNIEDQMREYVIPEDKWYVRYKVSIVYRNCVNRLNEYTLWTTEEDILEDDFNT
jgi:hypothetical protein